MNPFHLNPLVNIDSLSKINHIPSINFLYQICYKNESISFKISLNQTCSGLKLVSDRLKPSYPIIIRYCLWERENRTYPYYGFNDSIILV